MSGPLGSKANLSPSKAFSWSLKIIYCQIILGLVSISVVVFIFLFGPLVFARFE